MRVLVWVSVTITLTPGLLAKVNFGVSADESLVKDFDAAIGQIPRSRAIADLMVDFLERHGFRSPEPKEATS